MTLHRLGLVSVALATALTGMTAQAVTGVGSINHDIKFGGIIAAKVPVWKWTLPAPNTRLDLVKSDAVNDGAIDTWNILQNKTQAIPFLQGYMEATIPDQALINLDPEVSYLQGGAAVAPIVAGDGTQTLTLAATGNDDAVTSGTLALTVQPVLLVATGSTPALTMQSYAGVTSPDTAAPEAYTNADTQLQSQLGSTSATSVTYSATPAPATFLQDGTVHADPAIAGYASVIKAGDLSFPQADAATLTSWKSVVTVQVAYK